MFGGCFLFLCQEKLTELNILWKNRNFFVSVGLTLWSRREVSNDTDLLLNIIRSQTPFIILFRLIFLLFMSLVVIFLYSLSDGEMDLLIAVGQILRFSVFDYIFWNWTVLQLMGVSLLLELGTDRSPSGWFFKGLGVDIIVEATDLVLGWFLRVA